MKGINNMSNQKINVIEVTADNLPELQALMDKVSRQAKELADTLQEAREFKVEVGFKSK